MGQVYRAEDNNLGREVVIKVLPEEFASDPERLARFEREAKLLASLNHPNVAAVHGFDAVEGKRFLVLEDASHPLYLSSGHLLFVRQGGVMVAPFSVETLSVTGPAAPVPFDVMVDHPNGHGSARWSRRGTPAMTSTHATRWQR